MIEIIPDVGELEQYVELSQRDSLGFEYNDFFHPALLDRKEALRERIHLYQSLARPEGIDTLHGAFFDLVPFSMDGGIRRHSLYRMQQSVEIAQELGFRGVVFHGGLDPRYLSSGDYYRNWLETMTETMKELIRQAGGMMIACENVLENSPDQLWELWQNVGMPDRFGICLDVAHMVLAGGNAEEWLEKLSPCIRHFHLNDNRLRTDDHLALGKGRIPWNPIFEQMDRNRLGHISMLLEVNGLQKIRESLLFLRESGRQA